MDGVRQEPRPAEGGPRRPLHLAIAQARADEPGAAGDLLWHCARIAQRSVPPAVVDDATQQLAELALTQLDDARGESACWAYLVRAARTSVRRRVLRRAHPPGLRAEPPAPIDPERALDHAALVARLPALIDALPARGREVVRRFYLGGESIASIAADLGRPENTIKSRLHLARQQLRLLLQRSSEVTP